MHYIFIRMHKQLSTEDLWNSKQISSILQIEAYKIIYLHYTVIKQHI